MPKGFGSLIATRKSTAVFLVSSLALAPLINSNPAPAGAIDSAAASTCTSLPLLTVNGLNDDGSTTPAVNQGQGAIYTFQLDSGTITEVIPPSGFVPTQATDQQLHTYGFPPRPVDLTALAEWNNTYSMWKKAGPPGLCQSKVSSPSTSGNWAGMEANSSLANTYTSVWGQWTEPGWNNICDGGGSNGVQFSGHSIWTGLGGDRAYGASSYLLQSGFDNAGTLNNIYSFWEAINPHPYDTHEVHFTTVPNAGDTVTAATTYLASTSQVDMGVLDLTTGTGDSTGYVTTIGGYSSSSFYNGNTADFIDERPSGGPVEGKYFYLTQPYGAHYTNWNGATANGVGINALSHTGVEMLDSSGTDMEDNHGFTGTEQWADGWHACQ